ncbi:hypothetical protein B0A50_04134 [Salinomyces thailandicus]|uniref:Uncharacterized protein n=1 Tax=Salinomyces thailandicus TaxID=706561 RepID=A0A4U0TZY4_9PEZI|nr:hypothetical protein B0A50_04134 [Salinomyces thailandica]
MAQPGPVLDLDNERTVLGKVGTSWPIIIDANDVLNNAPALCSRLCREFGIDENGIQYTWQPLLEKERHNDPVKAHFGQSILGSSGIKAAIETNIDLDAEEASWCKEFDETVAGQMRKRVDEEIEDYQYLVQRALVV